ncbi:MAG: NUDIX domain-containing protein [Dethiobacter sp.]|jgi:dATP pyrophosphohydrolase|nr:NUDIX domain-containing protein [Dethiobacter sp.]MBS3901744.1 NUDIX domain-containing protein [Dethiobacter sp.]MBS3989566.1 NUDIX domain-containing protein [Dethiobacter sp.]
MVFIYHWEESEPKYLLLKRNRKLGGYWQPVTGFIEETEKNREAALRETSEETGLEIYERLIDLNHVFCFEMQGIPYSVAVLAMEVADPPAISISSEHTDHQWLSYQEARRTLYWVNNVACLDRLHNQLMAKKKD